MLVELTLPVVLLALDLGDDLVHELDRTVDDILLAGFAVRVMLVNPLLSVYLADDVGDVDALHACAGFALEHPMTADINLAGALIRLVFRGFIEVARRGHAEAYMYR
jgi:hypothetical protein